MTAVDEQDNELLAYLEFLFEDTEGFIYCPSKRLMPAGERPVWTQQFFSWPQQKRDAVEYIKVMARAEEIYVSPSLFSVADSHKENVKGSWVLWTDFDGNLPESLETVPEPTLKIQTSEDKHEHWYWKMEAFVDSYKSTEAINRGIAYLLQADTSGWDANQVLRPPTTFNHKRAKTVQQLRYTAQKHHLDVFDSVPHPPVAEKLYTEADLVDVYRLLTRYPWPDAAVDLIQMQRKDVPEGERSTKLMQLGYYCAEVGLSDAECYSVLVNSDSRWGKFSDRDDRDQRLNDIIVRARLKYPAGGSSEQSIGLQFVRSRDLHEEDIAIEWAIENCLEKNGNMLIAAKPGIGKTRLSLQAAICLALGEDFLSYGINKQFKVGFFSLEMHRVGIKAFQEKMYSDLTKDQIDLLQENLLYVPLGENLNVLDKTNQQSIYGFVEQNNLDFLFFDSLGRLTSKSLDADENVKPIFDFDSALRKNTGIATWMVHHNRKAQALNKKPRRQDDVYGSVYVSSSPSDIYILYSEDDTNSQIEMINVKHRYCEMEQPYVLKSLDSLMFEREVIINITKEGPTSEPPTEPEDITDDDHPKFGNAPDF